VTLDWIDIAVLLAIVLAGCAATYLILHRFIRRISSERNAETAQQLTALTDALHALEMRLATLHESSEPEADQFDAEQKPQVEAEHEEVAPGILAAIAAASAAVFGRHAHIRSVRALPPHQGVNPWSQQGRVFVQGSHNLRSRK
jgi:hypothetical protein